MTIMQTTHLWTKENPKPVAHALLVAPNQKICLEKNPKLRGLSFLGGKVEKWETSVQAIIREIREETGDLVSLHADSLILVESNREYFPQMSLMPWSDQGTWFVWDLYVWQISDTLLATLESTRKNISTWFLQSYVERDEREFWWDKTLFLDKISRCQKALMQNTL